MARLKSSRMPVEGKACGSALGEALLLGLRLAEGETEGDTLAEGEALAEGESDALGETDGEPANPPTISTSPTAVGEPALRVKLAEAVLAVALNVWSAQTIPSPSIRLVQPAGAV